MKTVIYLDDYHNEKTLITAQIEQLKRKRDEAEKELQREKRKEMDLEHQLNQKFKEHMNRILPSDYRLIKSTCWYDLEGPKKGFKLLLIHPTHSLKVETHAYFNEGSFRYYHLSFFIQGVEDMDTVQPECYQTAKNQLEAYLQEELEQRPETRLLAVTSTDCIRSGLKWQRIVLGEMQQAIYEWLLQGHTADEIIEKGIDQWNVINLLNKIDG